MSVNRRMNKEIETGHTTVKVRATGHMDQHGSIQRNKSKESKLQKDTYNIIPLM